MSLMAVEKVTRVYGEGLTQVNALTDASFSVEPGEFVTIVGPSGSGKSTLLSLLGGMNPPSAGHIIVDGKDIYQLSIERQADFRRCFLGFVFQQAQLIPYLTAIENVALPLLAVEGKSDLEAASLALQKVGLGDKFDRLPGNLSGGEQCRVAIARALVTNPPILLADEPTGSLDSRTGGQILALLGELNDGGQTILMVTHNPEAAATAKRVISLADGCLADDHVNSRPRRWSNITILRPCASSSEIVRSARMRFEETTGRTVSLMQALFTLAIASQVFLGLYLVFQNITGNSGH